jgi:Carboxypeptidase regulatory-like domain
MDGLPRSMRTPRRIVFAFLLMAMLLAMFVHPLAAQSTFGDILGIVRDQSGAVVRGAQVTLVNVGTTASHVVVTDDGGNYAFKNVDVGQYQLTFAATGFETDSLPPIELTARETRRIDAELKPGSASQTVVVAEDAVPVVTTDVSNLAETKQGDELVSLPVAIYSRSTGSTSPISTLTTEAGVQTDDSGDLEVLGTSPALLSVTIDGISSVGVEYSGPVNEMFPSFNSIEEIRISESNNNAEFSGVADITTVSKAGTIHYHGGLFEYDENTAFNSNNPFALSKPRIIMNDFGGTLGGPLRIPHIIDRPDSTFFFASYEGLRLPRQTPVILSVPSNDMRNGNLTDYLNGQGVSAIYGADGTPLNPASVPISQIAANVLQYLYPAPNYGDPSSYANNYQINFPSPISSNQGDIRLDRTLTDRQSIFARFSYKNRQVVTAPSANCVFTYCAEAGSPLQGTYSTPEIDEGLTFAHNFIISPTLLNEFRGGYNAQHTSETQSYSTSQILSQTGFTVPQPDTQWSEAPQVLINGFMSTGAGNPGSQRGQIIQALDNLTWSRGGHTFKFGIDLKRLSDHDDNVYGNYRSGWYVFDSSSSVGQTVGDPYTAFLLGYPDYSMVSTVNNPTMNGLGYAYAWFAQDDWKVTPNLTFNLGLRYELHPPISDTRYNQATFQPDYKGNSSSGPVTGAVIVPNTQAESFESNDFVNAIFPTPTMTASQAGIPAGLRFTNRTDFGPRLGFAWRPYGNDKTVLRGGWGRFIETPLGFSLVAGWAVDASYEGTYSNDYGSTCGIPLYTLANPFTPSPGCSTGANSEASVIGTAGFYYSFPIHYVDPYVQQWNVTVEQDLTHSIGMRLSYAASHGSDLEAMVDLNQVPANPYGYSNPSPAPAVPNACVTDTPQLISDQRPYPCWSVIQSVENADVSNYSSATVEVSRHSGKSITFDASYTFARDLSDAGGATPSAFAVAGGSFLTDRFHPRLDYGNVVYDRRHRFMATYEYTLPFGRGQQWLNGSDALNTLVGGWQLAGVTILQSGPFLTPYQQSVDPANTNILVTVGQSRTDQLTTVPLYAQHRTTSQWLNPNAFPYQNLAVDYNGGNLTGIGRFGNAPVGGVVGPGTANFSLSLTKAIPIHDQLGFNFSAEAANVFNHRNYEPPNMQVDSGGFGSITGLQTAEGAGPRSLELTGRFNF